MDKYQELIFRKNPHYIFISTIILTIILLTGIFIGTLYKYNKYYYLTGLQVKEGGINYVNVLVPHDEMDIIKNYNLIINKTKQNFTYEISDDYYNNSNKLYKEVKIFTDTYYEGEKLIDLVFESNKTTFIKEIKNKIKKGMI